VSANLSYFLRYTADYAADSVLVLGILGGLGEVETSSDDGFAVDDDDFVMGNGLFRIDHGRHPLIPQEIGRRILLRALALVQDDVHLYVSLVSGKQRLRNRRRGEAIRLDQYRGLGSTAQSN
jgi:hypothetical protein